MKGVTVRYKLQWMVGFKSFQRRGMDSKSSDQGIECCTGVVTVGELLHRHVEVYFVSCKIEFCVIFLVVQFI